jgi:hypothetical protein
MLLPTLLLVVLAAAGIVTIAMVIAFWGREDVPRDGPSWLGPSAQETERTLCDAIDRMRAEAGGAPLREDPAIIELAHHHAFDMAMRGFCGDADPEGVDLSERRRRLHPHFVGVASQLVHLHPTEVNATPASLARALAALPGLAEAVADDRWDLLGVGVSLERERCGCCIVFGRRWATLDNDLKGALHPSGWTIEGQVAEGTTIDQLASRPWGSDGAERPAVAVESAREGRFQLHLEVPMDSWVEIVRAGVAGLKRNSG